MRRTLASPILAISSNSPSAIFAERIVGIDQHSETG
jgi:hypothetical protein